MGITKNDQFQSRDSMARYAIDVFGRDENVLIRQTRQGDITFNYMTSGPRTSKAEAYHAKRRRLGAES